MDDLLMLPTVWRKSGIANRSGGEFVVDIRRSPKKE